MQLLKNIAFIPIAAAALLVLLAPSIDAAGMRKKRRLRNVPRKLKKSSPTEAPNFSPVDDEPLVDEPLVDEPLVDETSLDEPTVVETNDGGLDVEENTPADTDALGDPTEKMWFKEECDKGHLKKLACSELLRVDYPCKTVCNNRKWKVGINKDGIVPAVELFDIEYEDLMDTNTYCPKTCATCGY